MVRQTSVHSELQSILGAGAVRHDASAFAVDGVTPQAVAEPSTYEQTAETMRYAHSEGLAVIPWGDGSHMHLGNTPRRYDVALSLRRLDGVVEHEPADLTVTCRAGTALEALQRRLARHGQMVPLGPLTGKQATVGGALAANAYGAWRHAYGTARDFTIGMQVVTADGRVTRAGGRVVKNVAGYDLCKLYIGSLGTLGVIVEATFKLAPLPKATQTVIAGFGSAADACALAADIRRRGLTARSLIVLNTTAAPPEAGYALLIELAGTPQAVERSMRDTHALAPSAREQPEAATARAFSAATADHPGLLCKIAALPSQLPELIQRLESEGEPRLLALPTVGVVFASWHEGDDSESRAVRAREAAAAAGASLVVERCPPALKQRLDVLGEPPAALPLMRRVKQQFDPKGVLSPGRFVGRL